MKSSEMLEMLATIGIGSRIFVWIGLISLLIGFYVLVKKTIEPEKAEDDPVVQLANKLVALLIELYGRAKEFIGRAKEFIDSKRSAGQLEHKPDTGQQEEPPAKGERDESQPLTLKELKEAKATKISRDPQSREALIRARQERKGKIVQDEGEKEQTPEPEELKEVHDTEDLKEVTTDEPEITTDEQLEKEVTEKEVTEKEATEIEEAVPEQEAEKEQKTAPVKETKKPAKPKKTAPAKETKKPAEPTEPAPETAFQPNAARTLQEGLEKTRVGFFSRLRKIFSKKSKLDEETLADLEEVLFTADIGVKTSQQLLEFVEKSVKSADSSDTEMIFDLVRDEIVRILSRNQTPLLLGEERPQVILVIGVNGVGKTTTIGKLASKFCDQGKSVMLVAGDTFRAAATEQLQVWGERTSCEVLTGKEGSDPSALVYDSISRAKEAGTDVILIDTAGRLHTKVNLLAELKKIQRVTSKALEGAPHHILLVLDANTGQNAISQAQQFSQDCGVTGIILTKLDGTAKGGVIIGISDELSIPIQFIGIGEQVDDLREFDADEFVDAIF